MVALLLATFPIPSAHGQSVEKVRLSAPTRNLLMWPVIMAKETGIYREEGLDVATGAGTEVRGLS
jgi:ABC-type nitrate/sulfonate/bicarbonate transport system substrate-binding protein